MTWLPFLVGIVISLIAYALFIAVLIRIGIRRKE
jgi:hypothetical protein